METPYYNAVSKVLELQKQRGAKAKQGVIKKYQDDDYFKRLLYYALNPMLTYKISERTIRTHPGKHMALPRLYPDIFTLCEELSSRKAVDDITVERVQMFLKSVSLVEKEFYINLIAKTLRLGVTAKTVNKIIPDLIPEWEVQQAYPIEKYPIPEGEWFAISEKLNGVRATYYRGKLYARSGEEHKGLDHIVDVLNAKIGEQIVMDGELTLLNKNGLSDNEAFRIATGIINADIGTADKTVIGFTVFDSLPAGDFDAGVGLTYKARRSIMDELYEPVLRGTCVSILPLEYAGYDQSMIGSLLDLAVKADKEGLMVNLDVPYRRKRHKGILKVKRFYTMDLEITGFEEGSGRLEGTLGSLVVDFKGNEVRVGSGFSDEQREEFWRNREELPGVLCEVKYKEISKDKTSGAESLQFPVFVALRKDKSVVNYE